MTSEYEEIERRLTLALCRAIGQTKEDAETEGYRFVSYGAETLPYEVASRMLNDCKRLGLTPPPWLIEEDMK